MRRLLNENLSEVSFSLQHVSYSSAQLQSHPPLSASLAAFGLPEAFEAVGGASIFFLRSNKPHRLY